MDGSSSPSRSPDGPDSSKCDGARSDAANSHDASAPLFLRDNRRGRALVDPYDSDYGGCRARRRADEAGAGDLPAAAKDMATAEFPITPERVELGRSLFFDPRLTIDASMSCSSCHQPAFYGTDARAKPIGVRQRPHPRHVPTNLNAGTSFVIHWRGDRTDLEDQVFQSLTSPITSGQPDEKAVIDRIARIPGYTPLFKAAFPEDPQPMTLRNIAKAVGAY